MDWIETEGNLFLERGGGQGAPLANRRRQNVRCFHCESQFAQIFMFNARHFKAGFRLRQEKLFCFF